MSDSEQTICEIAELRELLEKCLKLKVLDYKLKCLTKPGDNYGSTVQSLDVEVADGNTNEKVQITKRVEIQNIIYHKSVLFTE